MGNIFNIDSHIVIDIRTVEDYAECHIPNSINIPHPELLDNPEKYLNTEDLYLIICDEGVTSKLVVKLLPKYKLTSFDCGFALWKGPIIGSYKP